ncbi:MAG: 23S rRNA (adenine(2503)-C(2))-methyltransferase RlmN [Mogibacterium sp.]|nr:23S rRNA (adenine(2503)-C(2))-methyltransferase RlmN [Mogibacterium sp.]
MRTEEHKNNILDYMPEELETVAAELGEKKFRAAQIFGWLAKGAAGFDEMKNVPAALRTGLAETFYIGLPEAVRRQESRDGTVKCLFEFADGTQVESVFMKYEYGNSICISSQSGCRMGCTFCASTMDGLDRSLTGGEMLAQVLAMRNLTGEDIGHVVVMGMGEPFDNYDGLSRFIRLIHDKKGYNLGLRNITVSTCGIIPKIRQFAIDFPQVNLAVSLHASNQKLRELTMPVARRYDYYELMKACREYTELTGRRITFEYAVINGVNDSAACAKELASEMKGWLSHVNLIPLNEVRGREYKTANGKSVAAFKRILENNGVAVTVRRTLGSDIDAACGQLRRNR